MTDRNTPLTDDRLRREAAANPGDLIGRLAAEALRLRAALAESEARVRAVVPLGDISGVPAWAAESSALKKRIMALEEALGGLLAVIRDPNDGGMRLVGVVSDRRTHAALDAARRAMAAGGERTDA